MEEDYFPDDYSDISDGEIFEDPDITVGGDEEEFGSNFKDFERGGGLGGALGTKDTLFTPKEYVLKQLIDILTHEPFRMKVTEENLNSFKDIPNVKIRNAKMIACVLYWQKNGYQPQQINDFARKFASKNIEAFKIDFIRYKKLLEKKSS